MSPNNTDVYNGMMYVLEKSTLLLSTLLEWTVEWTFLLFKLNKTINISICLKKSAKNGDLNSYQENIFPELQPK